MVRIKIEVVTSPEGFRAAAMEAARQLNRRLSDGRTVDGPVFLGDECVAEIRETNA